MGVLGNITKYQDSMFYEGVGNGTAGALTLTWEPPSAGALTIFIGGVAQSPSLFTVSGFTVTPSFAIPTGAKIIIIGTAIRSTMLEPALNSVGMQHMIAGVVLEIGCRATFNQTAAPTGWVKDAAVTNDSALRVVTGTVGSGGTYNFSAGCTVVAAHTHTFTSGNQSADHSHSGSTGGESADHTHSLDSVMKALNSSQGGRTDAAQGTTIYNTGGRSVGHTHSFTTGGASVNHTHSGTTDNNAGATWIPKYVDVIIAVRT